jgi:hypothetical protein
MWRCRQILHQRKPSWPIENAYAKNAIKKHVKRNMVVLHPAIALAEALDLLAPAHHKKTAHLLRKKQKRLLLRNRQRFLKRRLMGKKPRRTTRKHR